MIHAPQLYNFTHNSSAKEKRCNRRILGLSIPKYSCHPSDSSKGVESLPSRSYHSLDKLTHAHTTSNDRVSSAPYDTNAPQIIITDKDLKIQPANTQDIEKSSKASAKSSIITRLGWRRRTPNTPDCFRLDNTELRNTHTHTHTHCSHTHIHNSETQQEGVEANKKPGKYKVGFVDTQTQGLLNQPLKQLQASHIGDKTVNSPLVGYTKGNREINPQHPLGHAHTRLFAEETASVEASSKQQDIRLSILQDTSHSCNTSEGSSPTKSVIPPSNYPPPTLPPTLPPPIPQSNLAPTPLIPQSNPTPTQLTTPPHSPYQNTCITPQKLPNLRQLPVINAQSLIDWLKALAAHTLITSQIDVSSILCLIKNIVFQGVNQSTHQISTKVLQELQHLLDSFGFSDREKHTRPGTHAYTQDSSWENISLLINDIVVYVHQVCNYPAVSPSLPEELSSCQRRREVKSYFPYPSTSSIPPLNISSSSSLQQEEEVGEISRSTPLQPIKSSRGVGTPTSTENLQDTLQPHTHKFFKEDGVYGLDRMWSSELLTGSSTSDSQDSRWRLKKTPSSSSISPNTHTDMMSPSHLPYRPYIYHPRDDFRGQEDRFFVEGRGNKNSSSHRVYGCYSNSSESSDEECENLSATTNDREVVINNKLPRALKGLIVSLSEDKGHTHACEASSDLEDLIKEGSILLQRMKSRKKPSKRGSSAFKMDESAGLGCRRRGAFGRPYPTTNAAEGCIYSTHTHTGFEEGALREDSEESGGKDEFARIRGLIRRFEKRGRNGGQALLRESSSSPYRTRGSSCQGGDSNSPWSDHHQSYSMGCSNTPPQHIYTQGGYEALRRRDGGKKSLGFGCDFNEPSSSSLLEGWSSQTPERVSLEPQYHTHTNRPPPKMLTLRDKNALVEQQNREASSPPRPPLNATGWLDILKLLIGDDEGIDHQNGNERNSSSRGGSGGYSKSDTGGCSGGKAAGSPTAPPATDSPTAPPTSLPPPPPKDLNSSPGVQGGSSKATDLDDSRKSGKSIAGSSSLHLHTLPSTSKGGNPPNNTQLSSFSPITMKLNRRNCKRESSRLQAASSLSQIPVPNTLKMVADGGRASAETQLLRYKAKILRNDEDQTEEMVTCIAPVGRGLLAVGPPAGAGFSSEGWLGDFIKGRAKSACGFNSPKGMNTVVFQSINGELGEKLCSHPMVSAPGLSYYQLNPDYTTISDGGMRQEPLVNEMMGGGCLLHLPVNPPHLMMNASLPGNEGGAPLLSQEWLSYFNQHTADSRNQASIDKLSRTAHNSQGAEETAMSSYTGHNSEQKGKRSGMSYQGPTMPYLFSSNASTHTHYGNTIHPCASLNQAMPPTYHANTYGEDLGNQVTRPPFTQNYALPPPYSQSHQPPPPHYHQPPPPPTHNLQPQAPYAPNQQLPHPLPHAHFYPSTPDHRHDDAFSNPYKHTNSPSNLHPPEAHITQPPSSTYLYNTYEGGWQHHSPTDISTTIHPPEQAPDSCTHYPLLHSPVAKEEQIDRSDEDTDDAHSSNKEAHFHASSDYYFSSSEEASEGCGTPPPPLSEGAGVSHHGGFGGGGLSDGNGGFITPNPPSPTTTNTRTYNPPTPSSYPNQNIPPSDPLHNSLSSSSNEAQSPSFDGSHSYNSLPGSRGVYVHHPPGQSSAKNIEKEQLFLAKEKVFSEEASRMNRRRLNLPEFDWREDGAFPPSRRAFGAEEILWRRPEVLEANKRLLKICSPNEYSLSDAFR